MPSEDEINSVFKYFVQQHKKGTTTGQTLGISNTCIQAYEKCVQKASANASDNQIYIHQMKNKIRTISNPTPEIRVTCCFFKCIVITIKKLGLRGF